MIKLFASILLFSGVIVHSIAQDFEITDEDYNLALEEYANAQASYFAKRYKEALLGFSRAAELNPENTDYKLGIALSLYELKDYQKANEFIKNILEIEPNQPDYHQYAGNIAFRLKTYEKAIFHYKEAVRLADRVDDEVLLDSANLFFNRGVAELLLEQYAEAILSFSTAIEEDSENGIAYYNRGICYLKLNKTKLSCFDFNQALKWGEEKAKKYLEACN